MAHIRGRWPTAGSILAVLGFLAGCGTVPAEEPSSAPVFSRIVGSCPEMAAPAMGAVRDYTGELFDETVGFDETVAPSTRPDFSERDCGAIYAISAAPAASRSVDPPNRRVIDLRIALRLGDDPIRAAEDHLDSACRSVDCRASAGIGDESFDGSVAGSPSTAFTVFRVRNAIVTVSVGGSDFSARPAELTQEAKIPELAAGARTIAAAIAEDLSAVLT